MRFQLIQEFAQIDELTREERVDRYLKLLASTTSLALLQNVFISTAMDPSLIPYKPPPVPPCGHYPPNTTKNSMP